MQARRSEATPARRRRLHDAGSIGWSAMPGSPPKPVVRTFGTPAGGHGDGQQHEREEEEADLRSLEVTRLRGHQGSAFFMTTK